ncbi:MAG: hypothetical protein ACPGRW_06335 [Flavobacteriaceae bacterium]
MMLDAIIHSQDNSKAIFDLEREMLELNPPNVWNSNIKGNIERNMEVEFEKYALAVLEGSGLDIEKVSVKTFYAREELLTDKSKSNK